MSTNTLLELFSNINMQLKNNSTCPVKKNDYRWTVTNGFEPFIFSDHFDDSPEGARPFDYPQQLLDVFDDKYLFILENLPDVVWVMDTMFLELVYISPSVEQVYGFTQEEAMALPLKDRITPDSLRQVLNILAEERAKEKDINADPHRNRIFEIDKYLKDGSTIRSQINARFLRDASGKPIGIIGITRAVSRFT